MGVDEDGVAGDAVDLGLGDGRFGSGAGGLGVERDGGR